MNFLNNQVVWITGASSGIGEAMAYEAAAAGAQVILTARREPELARVRAACSDPARVATLPTDLTAFDAMDLTRRAEALFGRVDVLVNNAGISQRSTVLETSMAVYRRILELDFFACVALTQAVLPGMIARGGGRVVVISSVVGKFGTPLRSGYAAAKHALHGFYEAARAELWRQNIRFTLVCPGFIKTQVSVNAITADGGAHGQMDAGQQKGMDADVCARRIWRAVGAGAEEVIVARGEGVAVWLKRMFPSLFSFILKRAKI